MTKSSQSNLEKKISKMPFEEAMTRLEEVTDKLSESNIALESMIEMYQEGEILKKHCQTLLNQAKLRIETISENSD